MLVLAAAWLAQGAEWARAGTTRELWVRAAARGADASVIQRALEDPDWVARAAALEALRRAALVDASQDPFPAARVLALAREHGAPEQAHAWAALAGRAAALELAPAELAGRADEAPALALARIALLERLPRERGVAPLVALCAHADGRVRDAAGAALAARGDAATELAQSLAALDPRAQREPWLDGLERLERQDGGLDLAPVLALLADALAARDDLDPRARAEGLGGIEAVRAVRGLAFEAEVLAAGLAGDGTSDGRPHALLLRAARAQRTQGGVLARALLEVAHGSERPAPAIEAAIEAAPRLEWLAEIDGSWSEEQSLALWERVGARAERLPEVAPTSWLDAGRPSPLRRAIVEAASALNEHEWLVHALDDADPDVADAAFRALAHAVGGPTHEPSQVQALHRAWLARPAPQRAELLRHLPRGRDLEPFRADLLALGEADPAARAACAELAGPAVGDPAVRAALERWLEAALLAAHEADVTTRTVAAAVLRALATSADAQACAQIDAAAQRTVERDPALAKGALSLLAAHPEGLRRLEPWLAMQVPARLRTEAALGLARAGDERAAEVLAATYAGCDAVLRARALRAIESLAGDGARVLASSVLRAPDSGAELARLAAEWFGRHGPGATLIEALESLLDPEREDALLTALARRAAAGDEPARDWLAAEFERAARRSPSDELEVARRESVLSAAALAGLRAHELRGDWLARPFARGPGDLTARLRGERLPSPTFLYRGELALARALASRGELALDPGRRSALESLDARFVAHLGLEALAGEPALALELFDLARVGLSGEDEGEDGAQVELELRRARIDACLALGRFDRAAAELERLLADWRGLRLFARAERAWLGEYDPAQGRDARARLESALWQARAWAAHASGEGARAAECAREAARRLGHSGEARAAQARLEEALR